MEEKYLKELSEIRTLMNRSSRFLSLSGLSGILAGIYALAAAFMAFRIIYSGKDANEWGMPVELSTDQLAKLVLLGSLTMVVALVTGILLSMRKARENGENFWDASSRRLAVNFFIPLVTGGIFCLILVERRLVSLVAPLTLIFYGLACVHASKYTIGGVRYLGLTMIGLGLLATYFVGFGLFFWAIGFGICHILYGSLMFFKYEK